MSKVRIKLSDMAREAVWNEQEKENLFNLPSFSAYASEYVTSIGEYLLTLPQQLLPLAGSGSPEGVDEGSDDAQYFATEWMFKVSSPHFCLWGLLLNLTIIFNQYEWKIIKLMRVRAELQK